MTDAPAPAPATATDTAARPADGLLARARRSPVLWAVAALAVLLLFNLVANPGFFALRFQDGHLFGNLVNVVKNVAPVLLIAVGMTLVIATRGIDLSVGAVLAISGSVAFTIVEGADDPSSGSTAALAIGVALAAGLVLGAWNGFLVSVVGIQPIIATLVLMTAGRGIAMLITDGNIVTAENPVFDWLGGGYVAGIPVQIVITGLVLLVVGVLTRRTALGVLIEAVGVNPAAARLAGVRARSITFTVYVFVAFTAAVAGLMVTANVSAADANRAGLFIELDAILAVVIGGTSLAGGRYSLTGTVVGALILQTLTTTVLTMGLPDEYIRLFKAVVIIMVFLLQAPRVRAALRRRRRPGPGSSTAPDGDAAAASGSVPPDPVRPASPVPAPGTGTVPGRTAEQEVLR
ncbi:ABC transporter permease [Geodermatophilus aquaeductus]|uniref:Monosaccharide ABC transporter membrane protein, CUT2 family n=1 Tax=Geodermatophilus aquaeductus TaxID=1564161 RepID=A0A521FIN0_9ACTN|nr:ABC transporter permease [Geodermatophilus aquaeductus]SMO96005.1 monosaccharide ABC transporter membrane protein, CUT2 family [Geodermatophilus aquaeductus]